MSIAFVYAFWFGLVYQSIGYSCARRWLKSHETRYARAAGLGAGHWRSDLLDRSERYGHAVMIAWLWPVLGGYLFAGWLSDRMNLADPLGRYGRWILQEKV